jgi:hypothetical protein
MAGNNGTASNHHPARVPGDTHRADRICDSRPEYFTGHRHTGRLQSPTTVDLPGVEKEIISMAISKNNHPCHFNHLVLFLIQGTKI